jgi:multiple sugar transport system substrate-binding protein
VTERLVLRGITWDHPRGLQPLLATAGAYAAHADGVVVEWEARSLLGFGEDPLEVLAGRYDLLVIDHPFVGEAASLRCLVPLGGCLPPEPLEALAGASVGPSFASYVWDGQLWALPIDAAAQVSVARPDLLARAGEEVPRTWDEVLALGHRLRAGGLAMAMPMIPTDLVPTFYTLAANLGIEPLAEPGREVLPAGHLDRVLDLLLALRDACHPDSARLDPPRLLDRMANDAGIAYCPLAFGYSNYARAGFRRTRLRFADIPSAGGEPKGSTLGGAGVAVSSACRAPRQAAAYALWLASGPVQAEDYFRGGGQPAHRDAWTSDRSNDETLGFFRGTLRTLDRAFLRPRWPGYKTFQDLVGPVLHRFMAGQLARSALADALEEARAESQRVRTRLEEGGE